MDVMTLAAKLTLNTSEFDTNLTQSEKTMQGLTTKGVALGNIASRVIEKAGKAILGFGKQTVQVGMEFDAQMSQVKALGQLTDENFFKVREKAMELGETTKFTAAQVGEAFSYMALAGWDTQEMLDGIEGMLSLAAASGEDLGQVSDIVTDALTALGLEAKDTGHFVDVLAAASANSNTTVAQMGQAFKYLATTGGVLGYTIDDVATALGLLANNGIKSSQAGTSMRQILNTLINPTDKAAAAMEKLGVSLFEQGTDKAKPLLQVMSELRDVFQNSDFNLNGQSLDDAAKKIAEIDEDFAEIFAYFDEHPDGQMKAVDSEGNPKLWKYKDAMKAYNAEVQKATGFNEEFLGALGDIGGLRGISSLLAIMKSTDKDFAQLVNAIDKSDGAAKTMADEMLNNLQGDVTIMRSAIEGLQIVLSDALNSDFRNVIKWATEEIGRLNEAFQGEGLSGMISTLASDLGAAIGKVLSDPATWTAVFNTLASLGEGLLDGLLGKDLTNAIRRFFGVEVPGQLSKDARDSIHNLFEDAMRSDNQGWAGAVWNDFMKDFFNASGYDQSRWEEFSKKFDFDAIKERMQAEDYDFSNLFKDLEEFDSEVKLTPDASAITAELAKGYQATVTLLPDYSNMPESANPVGNAKGNWNVPYDNFLANLHRGEMVLTSSQARDYRAGNNGVDITGIEDKIIAAIRSGMEGATVRALINGKDVIDEVNRNNMQKIKGRRFAG